MKMLIVCGDVEHRWRPSPDKPEPTPTPDDKPDDNAPVGDEQEEKEDKAEN